MDTQQKQLLLIDLCTRLPYGVIYHRNDGANIELREVDIKNGTLNYTDNVVVRECKPYLRLMSSITEEERIELKDTTCPKGTGYFDEQYLNCPINHFGERIGYDFMSDILDWFNAHHFDYRGLIPMGLALEAKEGMYKNN